MKSVFICYPKCSTCQKAKKFLMNEAIDFDERHIVEDRPSAEEILNWMDSFEGEPKKFFNTSGKIYREMGLKDQVKTMSREAMAQILSSDGMLIKRPILRLENTVLIGFNAEIWKKAIAVIE